MYHTKNPTYDSNLYHVIKVIRVMTPFFFSGLAIELEARAAVQLC